MISNKFKWAQISLNEPKYSKMGLNDLKWIVMRSNFNKIFTSDAYHCKAWYILQFVKLCKINVENQEKKRFLKPIFINFLGHVLWRPSIHAPSFEPNERPYRPYICLKDSSLGSSSREVSAAIILNLFWVVFHGILPQMLSNLYQSFTSDAIKLSKKKNKMNFWL